MRETNESNLANNAISLWHIPLLAESAQSYPLTQLLVSKSNYFEINIYSLLRLIKFDQLIWSN